MLLEGSTKELRIGENSLDAFLACLGIGTLFAIKEGALPAEAGIWSLAVPRVWKPLESNLMVSREMIEVFRTFDELSALQQLSPNEFPDEVSKLIDTLLTELRKVQNPIWQIEWSSEELE